MTSDPLMNTYKRQAIDFVRGTGATLFDADGKEYIDLLAGIAVCSVGHANPAVAQAVADQARELVHVSNIFGTLPMRRLAEKLRSTTGGWGRVFFCNSGAEANECAIKLARKAGSGKRYKVLASLGGFHGRTLATLAATGQPEKWKGFEPLPVGFSHLPFNDLRAFEEALDGETAAILVEPIQGERGVIPATLPFLKGLRALADRFGIPLIFDEVQTGIGRTGSWWAFQHLGVKPDIFTSAKALANGLPIGACIADEPYGSVFTPGDHGSTFGGGPVVCAAALAVLDYIEHEGLLAKTVERGRYLEEKLRQLSGVELVRGVGLMRAAELTKPVAFEVVSKLLQEGVVLNATSDSVLRFVPPLVISESQIDQAIGKLGAVLNKCST